MPIELDKFREYEYWEILSATRREDVPLMFRCFQNGATDLFKWLSVSGIINEKNLAHATLELNILIDRAFNQANNRLDQGLTPDVDF